MLIPSPVVATKPYHSLARLSDSSIKIGQQYGESCKSKKEFVTNACLVSLAGPVGG
jgi:hypothetical protein